MKLHLWHLEDGSWLVQVGNDNGAIESHSYGKQQDATTKAEELSAKYSLPILTD
jgi:hypothetical protein